MWYQLLIFILVKVNAFNFIQYFDATDWKTGRASGLKKTAHIISGGSDFFGGKGPDLTYSDNNSLQTC